MLPDYKIIYSARKTIALEINQEGLTIRAPQKTPKEVISNLVKEKEPWIDKKLKNWENKVLEKNTPYHNTTNQIWFKGSEFQLRNDSKVNNYLIQNNNKTILFNDDFFELDRFYQEELSTHIKPKITLFSHKLQVAINTVRIKKLKSRWGSCSSKKNLNFNLSLIKTPTFIIDYVIAHEVSHLKEMNHSPAFWEVVESIYPKCKEAKIWLKKNGRYWIN
ncbi:M48 family metallopeptidase [Mastigocoleus testarum]|uniref:YgjP-like metallopeptidase domain-containing protein n=1 Tax=Mastigocoleus testarum BC008 TaxID=371196 RepID=A0A0V7ZKH7_9CYAN|nr:SprT family zinc-dependent metalloprotease [Mastigocoleus testarum]KST65075.1 hypothetical protein BC008_19960 [Mastigocoleus testarum BC008]